MATLNDNPSFTANEIYEIAATDNVEGAATGASFGGIGIANQPHQQLANRTAYLKQRQDTNIANIATLQAFVAGFVSRINQGWAKFEMADVDRGNLQLLVQWGVYSVPATKIKNDTQYTLSWPIAFPNSVFAAWATNYYNQTGGENLVASIVSLSKTGATFVLDVPNGMATNTGLPVAGVGGPEITNGFSWLAIGF